ncbi:MAG TPA: polysaccharide biosynthesis/export family protein [Geobacteraceae bacterium]|nr:polysaccharide biosynthesis/export family protein [Geobacteraceae bacterium]
MPRIKAVLACTFLISCLAAAVPAAVPELLASGKWDLWEDSAGTSVPDREKAETTEKKPAGSEAAPVSRTTVEDETKKGDGAGPSATVDSRQPDSPTGPEAPVAGQNPTKSRETAVDRQPRKEDSVPRSAPVTAKAPDLPKENVENRQDRPAAVQISATGNTGRTEEKTGRTATAPQQPESTELKKTETGGPVQSAASGQPAVSVSAGTTSDAKKAAPSAGGGPDSAGTVPVAADAEYVIGPGDFLDISVWKDEMLSRTVVVLADGTISFPLIGKIQAAGRTISQVKDEIARKLVRYYPEPEISIEVKQSNSMLIYVIGRVNAPGRQVLNANIDVIQALAMAGGLNPFASRNKIKVLRKESGKTVVLPFRYDDVIEGRVSTNIELKRGDVIVVP